MSEELKERLRLVPRRTYPMPVMLALFEESLNRIEELEAKRDEALNQLSRMTHCVHVLEKRVIGLDAYEKYAHEKQKKADANVQSLVDALEKLARLGNGEKYGNSDGNMIARAALAELKDKTMIDTSALDARHHAYNIAERCGIAYRLGETASKPGHHMAQVHSEFAEMAAVLGYRIASITEEGEEL